MPRSIDEGYVDFLDLLKPTATESASAKSHRASIEACLKSNYGLLRFFRIGSFGNGTSISGFSDVDYLASLPNAALKASSNYSLTKVRTALDARFPNTGVRVDCPAILVPFGTGASESTEIVPAEFIKTEHGFSVYDIADCANDWMRASPEAHNGYVAAIDKKHCGRVKPLIRFIKAWKFARAVPISSFYLELRVAQYANAESSILYSIDVKRIFCHLRDIELRSMQDPMGISGLIDPCKSQAQKDDALSKLETAVSRAEKAIYAELNDADIGAAFDWWRLLYNNWFPTYYY